MIRIAICEDSAHDRTALERLIASRASTWPEQASLSLFEEGVALLNAYEAGDRFDLVILDILMEKVNGIDTARMLRRLDTRVPIVFLTISPDYALEGYDVFDSGYLLNHIDPRRFDALMQRTLAERPVPKFFSFKQGARQIKIPYETILYFESRGNVILLHDRRSGKEALRLYQKLGDIQSQLDDPRFLRCHQSYLVNMDHIVGAAHEFHMDNGDTVPIKVRSRKAIRDAHFAYVSRLESPL